MGFLLDAALTALELTFARGLTASEDEAATWIFVRFDGDEGRVDLVGEDGRGLGLLLEVLNIGRGVSPLKRGEVACASVLALPEEILS